MNDLIEKYLNQQLTPKEFQQFASLLKNQENIEDIYKELLIKKAFAEDKDNDFRHLMDEISYEYQYEKKITPESIENAFASVEEYEEDIEGITRGGELSLKKPILEGNYIHHLPFRLERAIASSLLLIIENNDFDELIRQEISVNSIAFDIDLAPEKGFKPGRYYWKLSSNRHQISAMGIFFIGKGLMQKK